MPGVGRGVHIPDTERTKAVSWRPLSRPQPTRELPQPIFSCYYWPQTGIFIKLRDLFQLLVLVSRKPKSVVLVVQVCVSPGLLSLSYKATSLIIGS